MLEKNTGFKIWKKDLFVGDILSIQSGYGGHVEVVERNDGFYLVDCCEKVWGHPPYGDELLKETKITRNLFAPYTKVDKNNPTDDPPFSIYCDQCGEDIGELGVGCGIEDIVWYENHGSHEIIGEGEIKTQCKLCQKDPGRKPTVDPVEEYFWEKYKSADWKTTHPPFYEFDSKEEVDKWFESMEKYIAMLYKER